MVHWRRKWQPTPVFLLGESHEQYEKAKGMIPEDESSRSEVAQNMPLGKSRGQLLAPERMKQLGQSGKNAQLWMCPVMKVKSHAIKNSTA